MVRIEQDVGGSEPGIAPGHDRLLGERLCRLVLENLPSGRVFVLDRDGRIVAAGGARSLTGVPVHGLLGQRASDILDAVEYSRFEPAWRAAVEGSAVHREGQLRGVDVEYWLQPIRDEAGSVEFVVATGQNVTARKRAERELQEERERLVRVLDGSSDGHGEFDFATGVCEVSRRFNEILGRAPELRSIDQHEWMALIHPDEQAAIVTEATAVLEGSAERLDAEHRVRRLDGSWAWVRTRAKVVARDPDGKPRRLAGSLTDITRYKLTADDQRSALEASEARYRSLHESMMDGFVQVGMDGLIRDSNEVYRQMLGYGRAELEDLTYSQVTPERWHDEEARIVRDQILVRGYSDVYEKEYRRKDGSVFPVELRTFLLREKGKPVGMWAIVRDLTERNEAREQLATTSRLAALGTVVAGVAHEINNPLAAEIASEGFAIGALEDMLGQLHSGHLPEPKALAGNLVEILEALRDAQSSGLRIARIVKDMASFARPDAIRGRSSLAEVAETAVRRLPAATQEWIRVRVEDGGPVEVAAPAVLLADLVGHLLNNAASATREARTGEVTIRIGPATPGRAFLEVTDHGVGMAPEVMARVFDPFFSTRRTGEGAGLGLSIAHSVVKALGGSISVRSAPGKGATFRVELPVAGPPEVGRAGTGEQEA